MIDTKAADRRELQLRSLEDIEADLDRLEEAHRAGTLRHTGNWTPGQVFEHVALLGEKSLDGFPTHPPAPVRWLMILLFKKKMLAGGSSPAGFKIPQQASYLLPGDDTTFEQGAARLRGFLGRVKGGERLAIPSPLFGRLTHEQWIILHAGHASLHLSFLHPDA